MHPKDTDGIANNEDPHQTASDTHVCLITLVDDTCLKMHCLGFVHCSNFRIIIAVVLRGLNFLYFDGINDCICFLVFNYSHHQTQLTQGASITIPSCQQEIEDLT